MNETNYLTELLMSYKETITELKKDKLVLQSTIEKLLFQINSNCTEDYQDQDADVDTDSNSNCDENSHVLETIFKIADDFNVSKSVKTFPSYEYFKSKGISRYFISKEKGLKVLREKYFESRKTQI